ncbi:restriction endonuclease subunit S [Heliorestis convoluta]|uniref:Type I restriction enzyme, S subunit n=1 Tax=Heliorestis convoluta TaxID=356322 RepID=A0A5Q2MZE2_9FIRM|nr:restriction endonuclease subunit S [Heliorestis convoluta]QGG46302.1 type I restriction enzyme, S subunit [Heliorestis convoluta]
MAEKDKKPEIRFIGFTDAWEQRKYKELAETRRGLTYKPSDIVEDGVRVLRSSNINEDTYLEKDDDVFVNESAVNIEYVDEGDILVTSANGSSRLVGKHAIVCKLDKKAVHGGFMLLAKTKNPYFLNASMSSSWYEKFISIFVSGGNGAIGNLNKSDLDEQLVYVPKDGEQTKIGTFFKNLDNLITLHQRKYDKLVIVKKSMLEKMFPKDGANVPEIRFAGFTDAWEQKKVGDVLTEKQRPIKMEDDEEYQLITVKRRNEGIVSRGYFKGKDILVKNYFEIRSGDYLISKRQVVHGANGIVPESLDKSIVSNEYLVSIGNKNITTEYWTLISKLPNMYRKFFLSSYGVDIEKLVFDVEDWKKRTIILPSLPEQERITLFFQRLDNLITLQQLELEKLKNFKKSMLEKMFV